MLRWLALLVLLSVAAAATTVGLSLEADATPARGVAVGAGSPATPVLSARRVPSITTAPIAGRRLVAELGRWVAEQDANTCLQVRDADEVLFEHRAHEPMVPASTQKLLTATGALLTVGADARFETRVVGPAPANGVVEGDLHLVGGGDPVLATGDYAARFDRQPQIHTPFEELADQLVAAGVREVRGSILGDESRFDDHRYLPEVWPPRFIADHQTGPLSALAVNDGFVAFPGDGTGSVAVEAHPDPPRHAAEMLTVLLAIRGVTVTGPAGSATAPPDLGPLAVIASPPVDDVLDQLLRESDNGTAELLLKEIGRAARQQATSAGGAAALRELLTSEGLDLEGVSVADGSGLSSENRLDCDLLGDLLTAPSVGAALVDSLSVAGENGTLARRFEGSPVAGDLRAKTGTLRQVTALAGSVDTAGDTRLFFSYLANVPAGEVVDAELVGGQHRLADILNGYPDLVDPEAADPLPVPG